MGLYVIAGVTYAFAAAVQPGPFQAFLMARTLSAGWRRTLPAALSPLLSDGPIILLVLLVLSRVPDRFSQALRIVGGLFVLYLAAGAFRSWRNYGTGPSTQTGATRRTVVEAAFVNLLNPNPYLSWSLVLGPLLLKGWRESPRHGLALIISFYATMVVTLAGLIALFGRAGSLGPRVGRALVGLSAIALAGFGLYQLWAGTQGLLLP
jgi:threonine/homoserine/homoserine lactone efflux protein